MKLPWATERLIVRSFKHSDLEPFLSYRNDPEVARYQSWDVPYSRDRAIRFIQETQAVEVTSRRWLQIAIELKSSHRMIGDVAFSIKPDDAQQAVIGYSVARPYWSNGYAFEAVSRLLVFLFDELNLHRVVAECHMGNVGSWKLLEKLGFRREAHLVENLYFRGVYCSEYRYALLMREWKEHTAEKMVKHR